MKAKGALRVALGLVYKSASRARATALGAASAAKAAARQVRGVPRPGGRVSAACASGAHRWQCTMLACACECHGTAFLKPKELKR